MTERIVSASRLVNADAAAIFDLIADPAQHPTWDGNDNTAEAQDPQRVTAVGDVFVMRNTSDKIRDNHVVEFEEGRLIAWKPGAVGEDRPGHLWRWQLTPTKDGTLVTHTYDWTGLNPNDQVRNERARNTTADNLQASLDRLAELAEG